MMCQDFEFFKIFFETLCMYYLKGHVYVNSYAEIGVVKNLYVVHVDHC